jgi:sulfur carrier protein ThiS
MTINIKSKAFLNDGIISIVMTIIKPGPGSIHAVNYDIENDKEVSTKELLDKYEFDSQKLIAEINKQVKINENIPIEERDFISIDDFVYTILDSASLDSSSNNVLIDFESVRNKPQDEKENYVLDNINKIQAYLNNDGNFVFVHLAELMDEELVVER